MSALLTKAFEKWVAECAASNLPARPDAIIFALMEREPTREDNTVPEEKITYAVNELTYGQLSPDNIVCSAVVPDDCAFSYDWICLIHQASGTLCGVIKTPVRQKVTGESLIRNFTIIYSGIAQAAQITVPPQSWQIDLYPELISMLKTPNRLSEIAAEGKEAQQESRDNLGLKTAATMDVQTDIYDRTEGRLAIPGAFGYGAIFRSEKSFSPENGPTEFVEWVKSTNPGQYAVTQYGSVNRYNPIIKGVVFKGMVDIKIPNTVASNASPDSRTKVVTFYGVNGEVYHTRCAGRPLPEWGKLNLTGVDFADVLSSRVAPTSIGSPDVGGLILAAYQGTADGDTNISMTRGYAYPGSSLTPLSIAIPSDRENIATATPLITTRGCRQWSLPGAYIALNGAAGSVRGDSALVGLFVRAA
ncbi:phage tail protein [Escherichia coli]|uniref:phage tail-collar fiber domain-containing protein n=1 Tax=Escherichia coli TaxID=562 RepID=UPI0011AE1237|nr:phage tail protein [Escherichia coli]EEV7027840.1 phage tail protein [Escherichia coli]EHL6097119.1 phage tail protein [Escherichia coli]MBE7879293.1 phage tail protein [Escherichia coli]NDL88978.1 phage tail protein [Escherichia coli]TWP71815.1 phage tail protein [Escherichia coli]